MQEVGWGKVNMIEAERRLLANALLDTSNERFVLVSEACIRPRVTSCPTTSLAQWAVAAIAIACYLISPFANGGKGPNGSR